MPRVRWLMSVPVLCIILVHALFGIDIVTADCWYDNEKHEEGVEVSTAEPCLNCTCSRGALLCYLRVCPRLPNPPPPGCILLHRYKSCCPQLICTDIPSGNGIEARSEVDPLDMDHERMDMENACLANGSIYGPGSAMDSSSQCEYCYCLGGKQRCVKPKCLLPLDGCVPAYTSNECCPVHYNCTKNLFTSTTTTTLAPQEYETRGGCIVDGNFYPEGGKILGVGHSICDNCYCLRNLVRCEPLSCAPPLLGCTPVIKPGECCAASYNCSGTIETHPEPNYGHFPVVSKEYAKLRKEVQHQRTSSKLTQELDKEDSNIPYYVIAETTRRNQPTTRQYTPTNPGLITQTPFYYDTNHTNPDMAHRKSNGSLPEIYYVVTKVEKATSSQPKEPDVLNIDADSLATTVRHKKYTSTVLTKAEIDALDGRINRRISNQNQTNNATETDVESTTLETPSTTDESTTLEYTTDVITTTDAAGETTTAEDDLNTTTESDFYPTTDEAETTENSAQFMTMKTVLNSTDCSSKESEVGELEHRQDGGVDLLDTTTEPDTTTIMSTTLDFVEIDLETKSNVATVEPKVSPVVEAILNITKSKEHDYDYDYNAPTLPPSLPNLRIIPFVAADALDSKKSSNSKLDFPEKRIIDSSFPFNNLFSPPVETEGGFVPKEPPLLDNFYDSNYHTTNVGTNNVVTSLPVPAITNPPKSDENNCVMDGKEVKHGESVTSEGTCAICVCFYGSVVCHEPQCPIPRKGCHNSSNIDRSTCCPHQICDEDESPTVVLDRTDVTPKPQDAITVADGVTSVDPFRDVIRTEPAPDLKLLIGDMSNYLLKQSTTTTLPSSNEPVAPKNTTDKDDLTAEDDSFSLDKIWQYLFSEETTRAPDISSTERAETTTIPPPSTNNQWNVEIRTANNILETRQNIQDNLVRQPGDQQSGVGLLKLAGCNIYGRMYRVGRIISELSGPCLECKCTEVGVQCETLKC